MESFCYKLVTTGEELEEAFNIRRQVFVAEQEIPEEIELDENDSQALHMIVKSDNRVIGTARVRFLSPDTAKLERMAVLKSFRRQGIGSGIISFLEEEFGKRQIKQVVLHAQFTVIEFYKSCGFEETGSPFLEAGIKHIEMEKYL